MPTAKSVRIRIGGLGRGRGFFAAVALAASVWALDGRAFAQDEGSPGAGSSSDLDALLADSDEATPRDEGPAASPGAETAADDTSDGGEPDATGTTTSEGDAQGTSASAPPAVPVPPTRSQSVVEEIVVTATKRGPSLVQDVPIAVTAFGAEQLDRMNFRSLRSLTYSMPNVQLEDIGTVAGYASFSIRGQGINSSIPSVDPTVGVFIDGVYVGTSSGLVLDNFDLEGIEVLRGPQGVLFGRNVTGGAILVRTKAPGDELEATARVGVETGLRKIFSGSAAGPILENVLSAKVAAYYSDTPGWFTNLFDGSEHGAADQKVGRIALRATPFDSLGGILRLEHGRGNGDGPAGQNHALFERGTFDFSINRPGFYDSDWNSITLEPELHVPFGAGTITSVTGWRNYDLQTEADIDATPDDGFYAQAALEQTQFSEELRYAGTFDPGFLGAVDVTTGVYYFTQDLLYIERRLLANEVIDRTGGGDGAFMTSGVFGAADWHLTPTLTLNAGIRYTYEKKEVTVSTISTSRTDSGGDVNDRTLNPNFFDEESWNDVSPKVGFQWRPLDKSLVYTHWAKGFRSGGYNFRNTTDSVLPGPFDSEEQNSYEIGFKHDFSWFPARLNGAFFFTDVERLQRELNVPGSLGVSQTIVNAGDATIKGFEFESRVHLPFDFAVSAFFGYLDGDYTKVTADLNRDGEVTEADEDLDIPRLAPKSWGVSIDHHLPIFDFAVLSSLVSYDHRDMSFFTDNNVGFIDVWDGVTANVGLSSPDGRWTVSIYGNNLLDKASLGGDTPLPDDDPPLFFLFGGDGPGPRPGPSFSPLNPGRVLGAQIRVSY